jgi:hypothetical protein
MALSLGDSEPCRGGCGKRVNNKWGYCTACRQKTCKQCGKLFSPYNKDLNICGPCKQVGTGRQAKLTTDDVLIQPTKTEREVKWRRKTKTL